MLAVYSLQPRGDFGVISVGRLASRCALQRSCGASGVLNITVLVWVGVKSLPWQLPGSLVWFEWGVKDLLLHASNVHLYTSHFFYLQA